jgi:hypothetical protein
MDAETIAAHKACLPIGEEIRAEVVDAGKRRRK